MEMYDAGLNLKWEVLVTYLISYFGIRLEGFGKPAENRDLASYETCVLNIRHYRLISVQHFELDLITRS
jgi:hypothetical protein